MDNATLERFEKLLAGGQDSALLRFTLGKGYLELGRTDQALEHLNAAVALQSDYTAAWKLLGKAREAQDDVASAAEAYKRGIEAAQANGDKQLEREMGVFLKRLDR
ncbi:MAG: tetratricopeptide repeat protein [Xanthomonadales bacterium]|nr:tetratricopeptide repeat protein [Xanthomonadales bacterium]